ncbi:hypothetical protein PV726_31830 [Streptomyces europaeiscabiei]|uniref:hypothetical protein n=1 Tax=Streptomyces europaeiscabiei TaxID=146819 RepID=UPI0029B74CC8|nr:hypothetical protein [Streptomyces europaeiscabiei]MDX3694845.1 hypothetical protein [Streptomyces europaeiscabiei]
MAALQPLEGVFMSLPAASDRERMISDWFLAHPDAAPDSGEDLLLSQVRQRPELAALFTSALLCDVVCDLHQRRRGHFPKGGWPLYALLGDNLAVRVPPTSAGLPQGSSPLNPADGRSAQLLQFLAFHMIEASLASVSPAQAVAAIAPWRPWLMPDQLTGTTPEVLRDLLREMCALEITPIGEIAFVHPVVRDYFGALYLSQWTDEDDRRLLMSSMAHEPAWRDVIGMAAIRLRRPDFSEFARTLAERADAEPEHTRALDLLVSDCLEARSSRAPELDATVRERAERHCRSAS